MPVEENKAIVRRHVEEWSNKNPGAIDELVSIDFVEHEAERDLNGVDLLKQFFTDQVNTYPNRTYTLLDMIAEGDKVAAMLVFNDIDPTTSKRITATGVNIYRISGGKIQELWPVWQAERSA